MKVMPVPRLLSRTVHRFGRLPTERELQLIEQMPHRRPAFAVVEDPNADLWERTGDAFTRAAFLPVLMFLRPSKVERFDVYEPSDFRDFYV